MYAIRSYYALDVRPAHDAFSIEQELTFELDPVLHLARIVALIDRGRVVAVYLVESYNFV